MRLYQKYFLDCFSFARLCVALCDPLWFNDLILTTKGHKGYHQGSQRTFDTASRIKNFVFEDGDSSSRDPQQRDEESFSWIPDLSFRTRSRNILN
jgi:hypothetical protein